MQRWTRSCTGNWFRNVSAAHRAHRWLLAVAGGALLSSAPLITHAQSDHPREHIDAYNALDRADKARDKGAWATAFREYREAGRLYGLLAEKYPDWNPDVVRYRKNYCANQVEVILRRTGKKEAELLEELDFASDTVPDTVRKRYEALVKDHDAVKAQLAELEQSLQSRIEAGLREREETIRRLNDDMGRLRDNLSAMTNAFNARLAAEQDRLAKAEREAARLKTALESKQGDVDALGQALAEKEARLQAFQGWTSHVASLQNQSAVLVDVTTWELMTNDMRQLYANTDKLREQVKALRETINSNEKEMAGVRALKAEIGELKAEKSKVEALLADAQKALARARDDRLVEKQEAAITALREEIKTLQERTGAEIGNLREDKRQLRAALSDAEKEMARVRELEAKVQSLGDELKAARKTAEEQITALQIEKRALDHALAAANQKLALRNDDTRRAQMEEQIKTLGAELKATQDKARQQVEALTREKRDMESALAAAQRELAQLGRTKSAEQWEATIKTLRGELSEAQRRVEQLEKKRQELERENAFLNRRERSVLSGPSITQPAPFPLLGPLSDDAGAASPMPR